MSKYRTALVAVGSLLLASSTQAATVFDDFNVDEGHFNLAPNFSGSSSNIAASSTADRLETGGVEGIGFQQLSLDATTAGNATRLRHLSGSGSAANNTSFSVAGPGTEDGWIGFYLRTTSPDWNAQIWIEGPENNGSVPKTVIADGAWHLYEWNLDDETGGADGWGAVSGIVAGDADVQAGSYTIDSVLLRHGGAPSNAVIDFDFVARSDSGSVAALVPEPASLGLLALGGLALRRRRN